MGYQKFYPDGFRNLPQRTTPLVAALFNHLENALSAVTNLAETTRDNLQAFIADTETRKANKSTKVDTGSGLLGGGDLSTDRTLTVNYGTTAGTVTQGNDARVVNSMRRPTGIEPGDLFTTDANGDIIRIPGETGKLLHSGAKQPQWANPGDIGLGLPSPSGVGQIPISLPDGTWTLTNDIDEYTGGTWTLQATKFYPFVQWGQGDLDQPSGSPYNDMVELSFVPSWELLSVGSSGSTSFLRYPLNMPSNTFPIRRLNNTVNAINFITSYQSPPAADSSPHFYLGYNGSTAAFTSSEVFYPMTMPPEFRPTTMKTSTSVRSGVYAKYYNGSVGNQYQGFLKTISRLYPDGRMSIQVSNTQENGVYNSWMPAITAIHWNIGTYDRTT